MLGFSFGFCCSVWSYVSFQACDHVSEVMLSMLWWSRLKIFLCCFQTGCFIVVYGALTVLTPSPRFHGIAQQRRNTKQSTSTPSEPNKLNTCCCCLLFGSYENIVSKPSYQYPPPNNPLLRQPVFLRRRPWGPRLQFFLRLAGLGSGLPVGLQGYTAFVKKEYIIYIYKWTIGATTTYVTYAVEAFLWLKSLCHFNFRDLVWTHSQPFSFQRAPCDPWPAPSPNVEHQPVRRIHPLLWKARTLITKIKLQPINPGPPKLGLWL